MLLSQRTEKHRGLRPSHQEQKYFLALAKKLLQSKKFGVRCAPFADRGDFSKNETTMNRMHLTAQNVFPTTPKRGADACAWRADFSRDAGIPID
jgi:hypothetical protein